MIKTELNKAFETLWDRKVMEANERGGITLKEGTPHTDAKAVRLDFDFPDKIDKDQTFEEFKDVMLIEMSEDLNNIVLFGDVDHSDPFLRIMDGAVKHKRAPLGVTICPVKVFAAHSSVRPLLEVTVFLKIHVEWS